MSDLCLPMKYQYFDEIQAGTKLEEFRLETDYWWKRLSGGRDRYDRIILTRGYPKGNGVEGVDRLTLKYNGWKLKWITHPLFGPDPVSVFAIDVSEKWPDADQA